MKSIFTFLTIGTLAFWLVACNDAHDHSHGDHGHGHGSPDEPHADEIVLTAAAIEHHGIALGQAEQRELRETFSAPARLAYNEDALAYVGTLVSGRVSRLAKGVGDPVAAADLLFVIDSAELGAAQNDHLGKLAQLAAATTAFQIAEQYFQSGKELSDAEAVSRAEVQQREVALRAGWAHHMAMTHGSHGYLDQALYDSRDRHARAMTSLSDEFRWSKDTFAEHYRTKYTDPALPPIWMAAELISFGVGSFF